MNNVHSGREGENLAEEFLTVRGYEIIQRNYRLSFGEIDIIARDGNTVCFIEVKSRETDQYGHPYEAVTPSKQRTIRRAAQVYLMEHEDMNKYFIRFDVIGITYDEEGRPVIDLLKDAF